MASRRSTLAFAATAPAWLGPLRAGSTVACAATRPGPISPDTGATSNSGGFEEYRVVAAIRTSPAYREFIIRRAPRVAPDGAIGRNVGGFSDVAAQRDAIWLLLRGLTVENAADVDGTVRSLQYAFHRQMPAGNFANGRGASDLLAVGVDAFFLQAFGRIYFLVAASPFRTRCLPPLDALRPQLVRALAWLRSNTGELTRQDRRATNRLFFDALAFTANGRILNDPALMETGEAFTAAGLGNQRADGSFNEHDGADTSYQSVSVLNLAALIAQSAAAGARTRMAEALGRAVAWERARIGPAGEIAVQGNARTGLGQETFMGKPKDVNHAEVALALLYASVIEADPALRTQGESIARRLLTAAGPR